MADIGYIALFLAVLASIYSAIAFVVSARRRMPSLANSARNGLLAVCALVSISVAALAFSIFTHNLQLEYVAAHTSKSMPLPYLISALWAGDAGSLLLWAWLISIFATVIVVRKKDVGFELVPYVSAIITLTDAFFLFLLLVKANPFQALTPDTNAYYFVQSYGDGQGLNPLLQNPGMLFHPPALLYGYIAFIVPFAFAVAALLTGRLGDEWLVATRKWTLVAWLVLGLGNLIGAWWAYVELGWGGYWGWDPVENASLMPWLMGTAFLHSSVMQRRRGVLKVWNIVLIALTFSLAIFGMFLNRNNLIPSVHAFPDNPLGPAFLVFVCILVIGSLGLLYYRRGMLKAEAEVDSLVSRESTFLLNNLLLVAATFAVFLGTLFPAISQLVQGSRITLNASWFNQVVGPILLAIVLLAGICALIGWRRASLANLMSNFLWPLILTLALGIILFIFGVRNGYALLALMVCSYVIFTILYEWFRGTRARHKMRRENYVAAFIGLLTANRPRYGGYIVHIGIVLMAMGVIGSSFYDVTKEATQFMKPGDSVSIKNYVLTFDSWSNYQNGKNPTASATLSVFKNGEILGSMVPVTYYDSNWDMKPTEVAIRSSLAEDLYIIPEANWDKANSQWAWGIITGKDALGQDIWSWDSSGTVASFKIVVNPLVDWIWIGGFVLLAGGIFALWPQRQRFPSQNGNGSEKA